MFRISSCQRLVICCGLALASARGQDRAGYPPALLTNTLQKNYAVRFVYDPPVDKDDVVTPVTFTEVETEDPRFDTWSTDPVLGLKFWLSPGEMKGLAGGLAKLDLVWTESRESMVFHREARQPPDPLLPFVQWKAVTARRVGTMEIDVTCDGGSAAADLPSEKVCNVMEQLDGAFTTPTALNIFRSKRDEWGCRVPGFDPRETPPRFITRSEAAVLINLLPAAIGLRSKGVDIDWQELELKGLNEREYWFFTIYNRPRAAKGSAPMGHFAVNKETGDVWDKDSGKMVHSRELDAVEAVLRREHNISASWIAYYRDHPLLQGKK